MGDRRYRISGGNNVNDGQTRVAKHSAPYNYQTGRRRFDSEESVASHSPIANMRLPFYQYNMQQSRFNGRAGGRAHEGHRRMPPPYMIDYDVTEAKRLSLDEEIYRHFGRNRQPTDLFERKLRLRDTLHSIIASVYPKCGLYLTGSSMNGFGANSSDMDLCLMLTCRPVDQRTIAIITLSNVSKALHAAPHLTCSQQLIVAKVPILRIQFHEPYQGIQVDLNVNNPTAIHNTHLLYYYARWDNRVQPLALVVKEWARRQGISDASRGTLSSYSLTLMLIHYLQYGVSPPVLPSLQQLYPNLFDALNDIRSIDICQRLSPPNIRWKWAHENVNTLSISQLLIGFMRYYATFNYQHYIISVRQGFVISPPFFLGAHQRSAKGGHRLKCMYIEEPFTCTNTAHSVHDEKMLVAIRQIFYYTYEQLVCYANLEHVVSSCPVYSLPNMRTIRQPALSMPHNISQPSPAASSATTDSEQQEPSTSSLLAGMSIQESSHNARASSDEGFSSGSSGVHHNEVSYNNRPKPKAFDRVSSYYRDRSEQLLLETQQLIESDHCIAIADYDIDDFTGFARFHGCQTPPGVAAPPRDYQPRVNDASPLEYKLKVAQRQASRLQLQRLRHHQMHDENDENEMIMQQQPKWSSGRLYEEGPYRHEYEEEAEEHDHAFYDDYQQHYSQIHETDMVQQRQQHRRIQLLPHNVQRPPVPQLILLPSPEPTERTDERDSSVVVNGHDEDTPLDDDYVNWSAVVKGQKHGGSDCSRTSAVVSPDHGPSSGRCSQSTGSCQDSSNCNNRNNDCHQPSSDSHSAANNNTIVDDCDDDDVSQTCSLEVHLVRSPQSTTTTIA